MLWRYVVSGIFLLLLMAAIYPEAGEEVALVLYTAGLICLFYGILNSPRQPPADDSFLRPVEKTSPAPQARNTSALPIVVIAIVSLVILLTGIFIAGVFFLIALEESAEGQWTDEEMAWQDDMPQQILFTNDENGNAYIVDLSGDRLDLSDTQSVLFSPDGFQRRIGRAWITITPLAGFHLAEMRYGNSSIQAYGFLYEGEVLQYQYDAGLADPPSEEPGPVTGTDRHPVTGSAAGSTLRVVETGDGGARVLVNDSPIATFGPPYVTDAYGTPQTLRASFDPENRILTFTPETDDMTYPLSYTVYF